MEEDNQVLVHGDATPSNFAFGEGRAVFAFDMERVRYADRCFDVGRIAGELQHFFMRTVHDPWAAEEFIHHFLQEYSGHFPDREAAFKAITRRLPFYMGATLLRIARNSYLEKEYRRVLIEAAGRCLRRE
ncbi:MAG: phosphotransferase [Lentisphaeria bacterium]|nr:phosphotransferase [Lentisphaeria bacterium]